MLMSLQQKYFSSDEPNLSRPEIFENKHNQKGKVASGGAEVDIL